MTDVEHAKKYAEESISLAISMYNPKAEIIAETACLYGLTYKNEQIAELEKENAELKDKLDKIERKCRFNFTDLLEDVEKENKAREIIREYSKWECEYCDYKRNPDYVTMHCSQCQKYPLHKKAEQFLNEVEK